jgi:hypothetical protein
MLEEYYLLKSIIFWDITPCSPLSVNWRFGETYRIHLHGRKNKFSKKPAWKQVASRIASTFRVEKISWAINQHEVRWQAELFCCPHALPLVSCSTYFFDPEDGKDLFLRNVGWHLTDYTALYPRRCTLHNLRCDNLKSYTILSSGMSRRAMWQKFIHTLLTACWLTGLHFSGSALLWNVDKLLSDYMESHPRRSALFTVTVVRTSKPINVWALAQFRSILLVIATASARI